MKSIAIITARGGSKRIPGKNIKEFLGMPIIAYSIKAAMDSGIFEEVMVSTDSVEIADIARHYGASVPFLRSEKTSNDYATTAEVIAEVLSNYRDIGRQYDMLCCIYPTAPFVTADKLKKSIEIIEEKKGDSLMTVVRFSFPPQRGMYISDGKLMYVNQEYTKVRSQDLEPIYHDCGQFYFCRVPAFLKYNSLVTPNSVPYIMPEEEVQDIDTMSDWVLAEAKYKTFILGDGEK